MAHRDGNSETKITTYGFYYDLDLFSDFTYFLTDPALGDQFEQQDKREVAGLDARHTLFSQWRGREVENTFGLQVRNDWIDNGLYQTVDRVRLDKTDSQNGGTILPATTEADRFTDTQVGFWVENKVQWTEKFRSVAAMRGDLDYFDVTCLNNPVNSGTSFNALPSPKLSLIFGPWAKTEYYVQGGFDFHSNDGRGATQTVEPISADNPNPNTPSTVYSRPGPNQRGRNRRAHADRAAYAEHAFAMVFVQRFRTTTEWRHGKHRCLQESKPTLRSRIGQLLHADTVSGL